MCEVRTLFSASRWVTDWEAFGGTITLGQGPFGPDGERTTGMLEMMPRLRSRPIAEHNRIGFLMRQVSQPEARSAIIDFIARRAATRGR